jgi:antitoxin (DNA-binding transcriptional repressor) of toxin-antitoxin stability system
MSRTPVAPAEVRAVSMSYARAHWNELIRDVESGAVVVLMRRGQAVAQLESPNPRRLIVARQ